MDKKEILKIAYKEVRARGLVETKSEFADAIGENRSSISSGLTGNRGVTDKALASIGNKYPFFNKTWLATGQGEVVIDQIFKYDKHNQERENVIPVPENNYMMVELKDLETEAGKLWIDGNVSGLPEGKTRLVPREYGNGNYLVVRVSGHSMDDGTKRSISEGDELLIRQYIGDVRDMPYRTKLFVICTRGGSVVKQVVDVNPISGDISCRSFNKQYEDYVVSVNEVIQLFTVEKKVRAAIIF